MPSGRAWASLLFCCGCSWWLLPHSPVSRLWQRQGLLWQLVCSVVLRVLSGDLAKGLLLSPFKCYCKHLLP